MKLHYTSTSPYVRKVIVTAYLAGPTFESNTERVRTTCSA